MTWHHAKGHSQRDIGAWLPCSVNTIPVYPVSTFAFASQPSPFVSTYKRIGQDRHPWQKDETVVPIVAWGQGGRGCQCLRLAGAVKDRVKLVISLMKRLLQAAHDSLARTLVSLRFHSHTTHCCVCVYVCLCDSEDRQLSTDSVVEREGEPWT